MPEPGDGQGDLRKVALRLIEEHLEHRRRWSKILHDEVAQALTAAGLQLDILRMDLEQSVSDISGRTAEIQQVLETVIHRVRQLSYDLTPVLAERVGLHAALDQLAGKARDRFRGNIRLMFDQQAVCPPEVSTMAYNIAECAVDNAIRHSGAGRIEILVKSSKAGVTLEVRDDGGGFDIEVARRNAKGLGLLLMEHYAGRGDFQFSMFRDPSGWSVVRATRTAGVEVPEPSAN